MKIHTSYLSLLLCTMTANMSMAARQPFEVKADSPTNSNYGEFGRKVKAKRRLAKRTPTEADIMYRELIDEVELMSFSSMSMSMSMSMGMSLDDDLNTKVETLQPSTAPTGVPATQQTQSPTEATATAADSSCDDQLQVMINLPLEVDTADNTTLFAPAIEQAILETLSDEYSICGSRRRLEDVIFQDFQLRDIAVTKDTTETCSPRDPAAGACQVANAAIIVTGQVDGAAAQLRNSLGFLFENDAKFIEELPLSGVIEVRLKESGEGLEANSIPSAFGNAQQPTRSAVVAILSTAGFSVVAAIVLRTLKKERNADKYSESDSEGDSEGDTIPIHGSGSH